MENTSELIVGKHSIEAALTNPKRKIKAIYCTSESKKTLTNKLLGTHKVLVSSKDDFVKTTQKLYKQVGFEYKRIPSDILLETTPKEIRDFEWLLSNLKGPSTEKLLVLDQITDMQNIAAIFRTAAFFNIKTIVVSRKNDFNMGPSFYRNSSGAAEHLEIINVSSLSRCVAKLKAAGYLTVGFDEKGDLSLNKDVEKKYLAIVMGAEDKGMSNAVGRLVDKTISLGGSGQIKTLNVSVATAIALERILNT